MRIVIETDIRVAMRDGVELAADLYLPETGGPVPTLVERTPYDRKRAQARNFALEVRRAAEAGFAVLVEDTRGRHASAGTFTPFVDEATDGADSLAWVRRQAWCNGRVAMIGGSYGGFAQWAALAGTSPTRGEAQPAAIVPFMSASDVAHQWVYRGGALQLGFLLTWTINSLLPAEALRRRHAGAKAPSEATLELAAAAIERTFAVAPTADVSLPAGASYYREWQEHPPEDRSWKVMPRLPDVVPTALIVAGWHDIFLSGALADYGDLCRRAHDGPGPFLVVGPWAHRVTDGSFPERSYGRASGAEGMGLAGIQLDWLTAAVGQAPRAIGAPRVRVFLMGANAWRSFSTWPPETAVPCDLRLTSRGHANTLAGDGHLSWTLPDEEGEDVYLYDPQDPAPTIGGQTYLPRLEVAANSGPRDTVAAERRADVLCYTSDPLADPLDVIGPVELVLFVASSAEDTDFTGRLVDVGPDGRAEHVTEGILRARYRNSVRDPSLLIPESPCEVRIDLAATATRFETGHRVRLEVSSSNFPRFDRNPNTGGEVAHEPPGRWRPARNRVLHGPRWPSRLLLHVVPSDAASRPPWETAR